MKVLKSIIPILIFIVFANYGYAQFPIQDSTIVYDGEGNPFYLRNQMIVKFHPDLVDTSKINDRNFQSGVVSDFINPFALQLIIDSGYFNQNLANLAIQKVNHNLTTADTISVTRLGDTIKIPKFWSSFLIYWNDSAGMTFLNALDTLNKMWPVIEHAHPNYLYQLAYLNDPNDLFYTNGEQSGLNPPTIGTDASINIDAAWGMSVGSDNIKVGIFDTGINWDHEDFSEDNSGDWPHSRVKGGWNYLTNLPVSNSTLEDDNGHGTAIAGIIGAIRHNDKGVAGIAGGNGALNNWGVQLYDFKIVGNMGYYLISEKNISDAVKEAATSFNGNYGYSINVMNHSWFSFEHGKELSDAFRYAYRNGVIQATASTNFGGQDIAYPATLRDEWVMKVGANDASAVRWYYSTYGNQLDFIAPGVGSLYATTDADDNSTYLWNAPGTSYAAPHVAGTAALMLSYIKSQASAPNSLSPEDIEILLKKSAKDIFTPLPYTIGPDIYTGYGIIQAGAALQSILLPKFEVRHYLKSFNNNSSTKIGTNVQIIVGETTNGIVPGTYIGDVYEITQNFNITQPSGRIVLDVWGRNSSSTLLGPQPVSPEVNSVITSWNQTSATMKGYIYFINSDLGGNKFNRWLSHNNTSLYGSGKMQLTVYSHHSTASTNEMPINKNLVQILPNPSNGDFKIKFTLIKSTNLEIEVTDLAGKIVYSHPIGTTNYGFNEISLNLNNLNTGMYICNIQTTEGIISKKITLIK
jgi:subtilisin family serine protease